MDTKLHIVATLDTSPGMEGAVHIEGEGIERIHYVDEKTAVELVKRWNWAPLALDALVAIRAFIDGKNAQCADPLALLDEAIDAIR